MSLQKFSFAENFGLGMENKKLSKLQKWYLKYTDKAAYLAYKQKLKQLQEEKHEAFLEQSFIQSSLALQHPSLHSSDNPFVSFKHSGNSGDIIYSFPAVFALSQGKDVHFFLHAHQPINNRNLYHPLGNVMLNDKMIEMLKPLLLYQPNIKVVEHFNEQAVDYNLDLIRDYSFYLDRSSIVRWYFLIFGVSYDSSQPWLIAPKDEQYKDCIVIARSHRYRSPVVDYRFLKKYPNKLFLGLEDEYNDMKATVGDLAYQPVNDFLQMATIINSCKLFIGNQSFPFSLAEGLKAKRLLEVYYKTPNVIVEGKGANDFMYQPQFEYAVQRLLHEV